jgi:hypothetical protein
VIVWENPYARIPLRRDLFTGLFDERWGVINDGLMQRVFRGRALEKLEDELENTINSRPNDPF